MVHSYLTIAQNGSSLLKEKGSKFFGFAFHVKTEDDVQACIDEIRKSHHSARHHCYAYRLEDDGSLYRANDDGEPSHSAGDPILRQLIAKELTYTLVIVVRYFGGTKLGMGGLIQAYGSAAQLAIEESRSIRVECKAKIKISFAYAQMSEVMRVLKKYELDMDSHDFNITCSLTCSIPLQYNDEFLEELQAIPFIKVG